MVAKKAGPWGTRPDFPGFRYSMMFCPGERHTVTEVVTALKNADRICEADALLNGVYIRRWFP